MIQMWMIDTLSPFAPRSELEDFLRRMNVMPDKHLPEVQNVIKTVQGYLRKGDTPPSAKEIRWRTCVG
jgi:hypothetical protein